MINHRHPSRRHRAARRPLPLPLLVAFALSAALLTGCQPAAPKMLDPAAPNTFLYQYTAWDKEGQVIARGMLSLKYEDPRTCQGVWQINAVGSPRRIGPQIGSGKLTGQKTAGQLQINLNPDQPNYNVVLVGSTLGNNIDGAWRWMGVGGILNQGKFTAERKTEP